MERRAQINLLDKFFDMPRADALAALELYKASMRQVRVASTACAKKQSLPVELRQGPDS